MPSRQQSEDYPHHTDIYHPELPRPSQSTQGAQDVPDDASFASTAQFKIHSQNQSQHDHPPPLPQPPSLSYKASYQSNLAGRSVPMPDHQGLDSPKEHHSLKQGASPVLQDRPTNSRSQSWDLLAGVRKLEHSYEEFDSRNASKSYLAYADGDTPKNGLSKFYNYLLNVSVVTRWFLFIVPVVAILWIPGILGLTKFKQAAVWGVGLKWWSIWLTVFWCGWWGSLAVARIAPAVIRSTLGVVAIGTRRYIDWLSALHRYVALFIWTGTSWIAYNPLINRTQSNSATPGARNAVDLLNRLLFGLTLCAGVLLFEKFSIQWIAGKFHERSYAERIADQKFAVKSLITLYRNSSDSAIPSDDAFRAKTHVKGAESGYATPRRFFKKAIKGVKGVATTTTSVFGNVASEIAGSSVLQPNSPAAMVKTALESSNKSLVLARRIFYSFIKPGNDMMFVEDIQRFFQTKEEADHVFGLFDRDGNGDASKDEVEMACMEFHREQLSIEHSMRDLDSAVGRLDNIFMSLYVIIAILIIAVVLEAQFATLVTSAGTLILGLSWLIGSTLAEVLTSIIFLFIKHPFDVGDRVVLPGEVGYTVKEIRLLSTIFLTGSGVLVQAPNSALNTMFIQNIRRSPQMSEPFEFDVAFDTTFAQLEKLRAKMIAFLKNERRDYQPIFDVSVIDFPEQEKMTCRADIKYKSNAQQGALKAKRRNKWICYLKEALADTGIYGPKGAPSTGPAPIAKYTIVPWETVKEDEKKNGGKAGTKPSVEHRPPGGWKLIDKDAPMLADSDDIFNRPEGNKGDNSQSAVPPVPGLPAAQMQELRLRTNAGPGMPGPSSAGAGMVYGHGMPEPRPGMPEPEPSYSTAEMFEMASRSERGESS